MRRAAQAAAEAEAALRGHKLRKQHKKHKHRTSNNSASTGVLSGSDGSSSEDEGTRREQVECTMYEVYYKYCLNTKVYRSLVQCDLIRRAIVSIDALLG